MMPSLLAPTEQQEQNSLNVTKKKKKKVPLKVWNLDWECCSVVEYLSNTGFDPQYHKNKKNKKKVKLL